MDPLVQQGGQYARWAWWLGVVAIAFIAGFAFWAVLQFLRGTRKR